MSSQSSPSSNNSGNKGSPTRNDTNDDASFMSKFPLPLIYRVLFTDPVDITKLSMSGLSRIEHTPTFLETAQEQDLLSPSSPSSSNVNNSTMLDYNNNDLNPVMATANQVSKTIRKAYNDLLLNQIISQQSYQPLLPLILEIHDSLRSLIPNRRDLHNVFNDENVLKTMNTTNLNDILSHLMKVGEALSLLESEDRSLTTKQFIDEVSRVLSTNNRNIEWNFENELKENQIILSSSTTTIASMSLVKFAIASISYLHTKAGMCQQDIADFQFGHFIAPRIYAGGISFLRKQFESQYGKLDADTSTESSTKIESSSITIAPLTRKWIEEIIQHTEPSKWEELTSNNESRFKSLVCTGWVDNILFRSPRNTQQEDQTPFLIPEVISDHVLSIRQIRLSTKISVVGSALALHAASLSGVGEAILRMNPLRDDIMAHREILVSTLSNRAVGSQELYEKAVGDATVSLAKVLNPSLNTTTEESIRSRTISVLRGEDPVLQLLDNRMRGIFRDMVLWDPQSSSKNIPVYLQTGRFINTASSMPQHDNANDVSFDTLFKKAARNVFITKGFSFYAEELSECSLSATRIIHLSVFLFGSSLLDKLFIDVCHQLSENS